MLTGLQTRRSVSVRDMVPPAPGAAELKQILTIATRVPDHGKLCPWRLVVLREAGQRALGHVAARQFRAQHADATPAQIAAEEVRFARAPLCIAVLSTPKLGTKPVWEQELSAGAVCMNILHAAHALGFGGKWLTEWVAYDAEILAALLSPLAYQHKEYPSPPLGERLGEGDANTSALLTTHLKHTLTPTLSLGEGEGAPRIAGFIYLGSKTSEPEDRERPALADVVKEW